MSQHSIDLFAGFKAPSSLLSGGVGHGHSIRLDRLSSGGTYQPPSHLFVLYISISDDGRLVCKHREKDIVPTQVGVEEDVLIAEARLPATPSGNFDLIKFTEPSFFTIVLDADGWDFYYPDPGSTRPDPDLVHDPLIFLPDKTVIHEIPRGSGDWYRIKKVFSENYTFYNAQLVTKSVAGATRQALRCINFFTKNAKGDPLDMGKQDFGFNIIVQVPLSSPASEKVTLHIDPTGQNQGPPPPPPPFG